MHDGHRTTFWSPAAELTSRPRTLASENVIDRPRVPARLFHSVVVSIAVVYALAVAGAGPVRAATAGVRSLVGPVATSDVGSVRITTSPLNARGHPVLTGKSLFIVPAHTAVRVYRSAMDSAGRSWYLVHVKSRPGWIAAWLTARVPTVTASAWHSAVASSFGIGDGLIGNRMACGAELTATVMAVANRTLPCGTRVRIRVGSATVLARVMDRGPYAAGRTFDLAPAVCRVLHACDGAFRIEWQPAP